MILGRNTDTLIADHLDHQNEVLFLRPKYSFQFLEFVYILSQVPTVIHAREQTPLRRSSNPDFSTYCMDKGESQRVGRRVHGKISTRSFQKATVYCSVVFISSRVDKKLRESLPQYPIYVVLVTAYGTHRTFYERMHMSDTSNIYDLLRVHTRKNAYPLLYSILPGSYAQRVHTNRQFTYV